MKKIFGIEAEFNITADEDITKGIGSGIKNGSVVIADIIKELTPAIIRSLKDAINKPKTADKD